MTLEPFIIIAETEIEKWRKDSFWEKEPETLRWIESFHDGEVFFDVGANIGLYSLYCAKLHPNSWVFAFEPDMKNYLRLLENRKLNGFDNIHAFRIGMGASEALSFFYPIKDEEGASGGQIGCPINEKGESYQPIDAVPTLVMSLDYFTYKYSVVMPNHIKIDIDGLEESVIIGMNEILKSQVLKSVLIELNERTNKKKVMDTMAENGFSVNNVFNTMENHSRFRRNREGIKAENWIFTR